MSPVRQTEFATCDLDEAREQVARLFCGHRSMTTTPTPLSMDLRADHLGTMSLVHLDYGAPVRITPQPLDDFYLVQIPRGGRAHVVQDGKEVVSSPATASVLSPTGEVDMEWGTGAPHLCVQIKREMVERAASLLLGHCIDEPLVFDPAMPLAEAGNASWLRSVLFMVDELRAGSTILQRSELMETFVGTLAGQLLLSQPNNYSSEITRDTSAPTSTVQQAVDYIEAHIGDHLLGVPAIAKATQTSVRSLQEAFRRELGTSPAAYIKNRRMIIAHRRLMAADPAVSTVTQVATGLGISHLGRFSVEYKGRFGESPSETLASTKGEPTGAR